MGNDKKHNADYIPTREEIENPDYSWDLGEIEPSVLIDEKNIPEPEPIVPPSVEPENAPTVETGAQAEKMDDNPELTALENSYRDYMEALRDYNQNIFKSQAEIISATEAKINEARQKDDVARRRENAFRYISGLGDTLSSVANLVGTAHGAANQQQKYNSHAVVEKAEAARKARKLEMDDLSKRLDEMKARQKELKAAGSLKEAELKMKLDKEIAALKATQRKEADEAKYKERRMLVDEMNARSTATRAAAYEYSKENPTPKPTTAKPRYRQVLGKNGKMISFDVSRLDDFDGDYQKALKVAIEKGTSGLTEQEIEAYNKAKKLADVGEGKALKAFFDNHTPREAIVEAMIQNPIFGSL